MEITDFIRSYIELLVVCCPFVAVPSMLSLTRGHSLSEKKRTGVLASIAVACTLTGAVWFGKTVLEVIGIRIAAFQVAGGFVILLLALSMLLEGGKKQGAPEVTDGLSKDSMAIVPLAIPLIAGPGAISSVVVATMQFPGWKNQIFLTLSVLLVAISFWILLYFASLLERILGVIGLNILNRLGGLLLASFAVEIMSKGLGCLFPVLACSG